MVKNSVGGSKENTNEEITYGEVNIGDLIESDSAENTIISTISDERRKILKEESDYLKVLSIWTKEKQADRIMKIVLCASLGVLLVAQIVCINIIIFKIGLKSMEFDEWTIRLFITGVFAEIVALVKIIVNNLFPESGSKDFMEFLNNFYGTKTSK